MTRLYVDNIVPDSRVLLADARREKDGAIDVSGGSLISALLPKGHMPLVLEHDIPSDVANIILRVRKVDVVSITERLEVPHDEGVLPVVVCSLPDTIIPQEGYRFHPETEADDAVDRVSEYIRTKFPGFDRRLWALETRTLLHKRIKHWRRMEDRVRYRNGAWRLSNDG